MVPHPVAPPLPRRSSPSDWRWSMAALTAVRTAMAAATDGDLVAPTAPPAPPESPVETALLLALNAVFVVAGLIYSLRVLAPKPMTYLSEIAFPADVRRLSSAMCYRVAVGLTVRVRCHSSASRWRPRRCSSCCTPCSGCTTRCAARGTCFRSQATSSSGPSCS